MSVCLISRDSNKEIQEVYAPNGKPSILFRDALAVASNTPSGVNSEVGTDKNGRKEHRFFIGSKYDKQSKSVRVTENAEPGEFSIHEGDLKDLTKSERIDLFRAQDGVLPNNAKIVNHGKSTLDGIRHRLNLAKHGWTVKKNQKHNQGFKTNNYDEIKAFADKHNLGPVYQNTSNEVLEGGIKKGEYYVKGITLERRGKPVDHRKENALRIWARAYTPTFIKRFGNWELLAEARQYIDKVTGIYQYIIKEKFQQSLFEAAVQANSSESEKRGAIMSFGKELVEIAQKLWPDAKVGDQYKPVVEIPLDENGEPLIDSLLTTEERQNQPVKNDGIYENTVADIDPKDILKDIAENSPWEVNRAIAQQMLSYKYGNLKIGFNDLMEDAGRWYNDNSKIIINRKKIQESAGDESSAQYSEEATILHELAHALTIHALRNDKRYNAKMQELFDKVHDQIAPLFNYELNVEEFVAEALTNPEVQKILQNTPHPSSHKTVWNAFVDMIKRMAKFYGLQLEHSVLDEVLNHTFAAIDKSQKKGKFSGFGGTFNAKTNVDAEVKTWGSRKTIDFFEQKQNDIKLEESGDISYYTTGKIDPVTNTLKKYQRLTEYTHANFANTKDKEKFDPEKHLDKKTAEVFRKAGAALTDKILYGNSTVPLSYDEIKAEIKRGWEEGRYRGKIMHKMIEGYLKHGDIMHFAEDIDKFRKEGGISEYDLLWFDENRVKQMLKMTGINTEEFGNTDIKFRDNIASELMMVSEELGIGTSNDGLIEHSDGSVSFMDYKTGSKFLSDENISRLMQYTNGTASPIYDSKLERAKIELVTRMIIAKMNKPDLKVRDLKIIYISRYYGTQIRYVNTQSYLDYINNFMRIKIQDLEKQAKKDPSKKEELEQTRREYKAMKDAKVFDFYNYQGESKLFEQDSELETITDPAKKIELLKKRVATQARYSLVKDNEGMVSRESLKKIKDSLFAVLNAHKSAHVTDVRAETSKDKDVTWFASKVLGLREQANAFLQSISQMFEEGTDKANRRINELLGEQSEFRKADRALYKEYFQRTGRPQAMGAMTFSYSNHDLPLKDQAGVFDFMYTWKNVGGEMKRVGAVYTEADYHSGKISEAQWNYYKTSKKVLKEVYEAIRNKVAYMHNGKAVTYGEAYKKADNGYSFEAFTESFLPTIPFQNVEEIIEKNKLVGSINPVKITKEFFENYTDRYDLAIINQGRFNIGMPLKYMSSEFLDNDEHSYNVSRAIDVFTRHMVYKNELDDVYDIGMSTIAAMSDTSDASMRDSKGNLNLENSIFVLKSFLKQNIKGERRMTFNYVGEKREKANRRIDLVLDNIGGFISKNAFWFAPVTATFNGLYGLITNGKEGIIGSLSKRLYGDDNAVTLSHMAKAAAISSAHQVRNIFVQGNIKRQFAEDFEGTYYKDKVNYMMKIFRLSNKNYAYADNSLMLSVHNRILTQDNAYVAQGLGEELSNETLVIASMLAMKVSVKSVDANGKEVVKYYKKDGTYTLDKNDPNIQNMWDAYEMNEQTGEFEYNGPTRFRNEHGEEVKGMSTLESLRIKTYLERMYGSYSPEQRTHLERYALGRMAMKFRKFWIANIRENFSMDSYQKYVGEYVMMKNADGTPKLKDGQPMYAWQAEHTRARLLVIGALMGSFVGMKKGKPWSKMTVDEKKQATRLMFQLAFLGFSIAMGMGALIPPEDADKAYAKRITRLAEDLAMIHPADLLRGTTTIDSYPTQLYKAATASWTLLNSWATDDIIETGKYKGDYKGWNTVEDFIPVYHAYNKTVEIVTGG